MKPSRRTYMTYSIGLAAVWAVILAAVALKASNDKLHVFLLIFLGYALGWSSGTIARFVYPPPAKWRRGVDATP